MYVELKFKARRKPTSAVHEGASDRVTDRIGVGFAGNRLDQPHVVEEVITGGPSDDRCFCRETCG